MTPTLSIIVPCYNEEKTIRTLLDAIFAQTYPLEKMEVVIRHPEQVGHSSKSGRHYFNEV